jgi:asparagine synthase (glutamine-hydrolysing)
MAVLQAMGDAIAHRGPDDEGFFADAGIGLAHRRLSIIDLAGGRQPIANEEGGVQVVFNGEIYNYPALRKELLARGHRLATNSDTEALVHLYEDYGEALVERLRGMFAFALWDAPRRRLLLARDRLGLKPLYLYRDHEKIVFGSEIKAILAHPQVDRTVDACAIDEYLAWGVVPGEGCIFRSMRKLAPAHTLTLSADRLDGAPRRYWRFEARADRTRSVDEWREAMEAKIDETVSAHLLADVPVGALLSGGLDSSAIVAALAKGGAAPQTFSIGFHDAAFSETPFAAEVAEQFGLPHTSQIVTPEAAAALDDLVTYYDEPFADPSAVPSIALARLAVQSVKVALSGDGGDEAFGGYARYVHDLQEARWRRRIPAPLRRTVLASLARLWPKADWLPRPLRAKTALTNLSLDGAEAYANTLAICRPGLRGRLLRPEVSAPFAGRRAEQSIQELYALAPAGDPLAGMITADIGVLLPDDFLTKVDRASMSCGLEVRPPLVDHELLELAASLPSELKIREGRSKWLLKEIYGSRLPANVTRRRKQGFDIPVDDWLRGPLRDTFHDAVLSPTARVGEWISQPAARSLYRQHQARVGRHGKVLWSLLILACWAERYLSPSYSSPAASAQLAELPGSVVVT